VIWLPGDLPAAAQKIVLWNPLVHIVGLARSGLYPTYRADYAAPGFVIAVALALCAVGLAALRLHGRRFSEG
jgi:capsular polysaccharide transport system permease protein